MGVVYIAGKDGRYVYIRDLLMLNQGLSVARLVKRELARVVTPLKVEEWEKALKSHSDADFARYIVEGLKFGFRLGMRHHMVKNAKANLPSARRNPQVIEDYLDKECREGNILGPFSEQSMSGLVINRLGCIPKKYRSDKWRVITDLSHPQGCSVNDTIDPSLCSLSYISVDEVARVAMSLGKGALLAKVDIKAAYRLVPVHPVDRSYLGMKWKQSVYVDGMLPFGLRSAPKIFTAVADALEWCIRQQGVCNIFHYLDDFVVVGLPESDHCKHSLEILEKVCSLLGVPLAPEKKDGPTHRLVFLGIIIDTVLGQLILPQEKLQRLLEAVEVWIRKRSCTRRELESLIGTLQHACKVIKPGRVFLRRLIARLSVAKASHHHIRLNREFKEDLMWWKVLASSWNGTAIIMQERVPSVHLTSDASGAWGCGA